MRAFLIVLLFCAFGMPSQAQPDPSQYVLSITNAAGLSGDSVEVRIVLDFPQGEPITAFMLGVCDGLSGDGSVIDIPCTDQDCVTSGFVVPGADLAATNNGLGPEFFSVRMETDPSHGWTVWAVNGLLEHEFITPREDAELVVARYDLVGPPGTMADLSFCSLGEPLFPTPDDSAFLLIDGTCDFPPEVEGGTITVGPLVDFIRGDVDSNGAFNGLADGLFLLQSMFLPGFQIPACLEAADIDGDGTLNGLQDALHALNHQFVPGSAAPPSPFPGCGSDSDPAHSLGCAESSACL